MNARIDRTENDFIGHLQKVEDKLDKIAEITKTVALLQQQTNQHNDQLGELRTQLRESQSKTEESIARIHGRLDDMVNNQRDRLDIYTKEVDVKIDAIKSTTGSTEKELKQWLNRGIGAWVIFVFVMGAIQTGVWKWVDSIEREKEVIVKQMNLNTTNVDKHTQQLDIISRTTAENQSSVRRLEQMSFELDMLKQHSKK